MNYLWGATQSAAVPRGWIVQNAPANTLALLLVPPVGDDEVRHWLVSLLLDQFLSEPDYTATLARLSSINGHALPLDPANPVRDYFIPIDMLQPELASHFTAPVNPAKSAIPAGFQAAQADNDLSAVQPTQPGAYAALKPDLGTPWSIAIYQAALTGNGAGVLVTAANVRYASTPITDTPTPASAAYVPFFFVSPNFGTPDNPLESVPVTQDFYNRVMDQHTVPTNSGVQKKPDWEKLAAIASLVFIVFKFWKENIHESED